MSRKNLDTLQIKNVESTESKGPLLENIKDKNARQVRAFFMK